MCLMLCFCILIFYHNFFLYFLDIWSMEFSKALHMSVPRYVISPISQSPFRLLCNPKFSNGGILPFGFLTANHNKQSSRVLMISITDLLAQDHSCFIIVIESSKHFGTPTPSLHTLLALNIYMYFHFYFLRQHHFAGT